MACLVEFSTVFFFHFWKQIHSEVNKLLAIDIQFSLGIFILHDFACSTSQATKVWLANLLMNQFL